MSEHVPQQPPIPGQEDQVCCYCKQKGHWMPDCNLKGHHEFLVDSMSWEEIEIRCRHGVPLTAPLLEMAR